MPYSAASSCQSNRRPSSEAATSHPSASWLAGACAIKVHSHLCQAAGTTLTGSLQVSQLGSACTVQAFTSLPGSYSMIFGHPSCYPLARTSRHPAQKQRNTSFHRRHLHHHLLTTTAALPSFHLPPLMYSPPELHHYVSIAHCTSSHCCYANTSVTSQKHAMPTP